VGGYIGRCNFNLNLRAISEFAFFVIRSTDYSEIITTHKHIYGNVKTNSSKLYSCVNTDSL
jgi:hypothetical protein